MSSSFQCGRSTKNDTCLPWQMSMATYFSLLFDDGVSMTVASYTLFGWITLKTVPACPERDLLPLSRAAQLGEAPELQEAGSGCHHRSCCLCYQTWSRLGSGCCPCAVRSLRSATRILGVTGRDIAALEHRPFAHSILERLGRKFLDVDWPLFSGSLSQ